MRILAIRGENLASIAGPFEVRLDAGPLASAGLFAITGPTGAGKSTLLDALCLALFDQTPRLDQRGGPAIGRHDDDEKQRLGANDVRSILRRGAPSGFAEVDFEGRGGKRYRARWSVRRARDRVDGQLQLQSLELSELDGGERIGRTRTEVLAAIEERLGLGFEQFRRSALLAQGDFAAFLRASADERAKLLERMTGTELYRRISMAAHEADREAKKELELANAKLGELRLLSDEERAALEASLAEARSAREKASALSTELGLAAGYYDTERTLREGLAKAEGALAAAREDDERIQPKKLELAGVLAAIELAPLLDANERAASKLSLSITARTAREAELAASQRAFEEAAQRATAAGRALELAEKQHRDTQPSLARAGALDAQLAQAAAHRDERTKAARESSETVAKTQAGIEAARGALAELEEERARCEAWLTTHGLEASLVDRWDTLENELGQYTRAHAEARSARTRCGELAKASVVLEKALAERALAAQAAKQALDECERASKQAEAEANEASFGEAHRNERERALRTLERAKELGHLAAQASELETKLAALQREQSELRSECEAGAARAGSLGRDLESLESDLARAEVLARQARATQDLSTHRAELRDGEPCPLCGSVEHPYAKGAGPLAELVRTADESVRVTRERRDAAQAELAKLAARGETLEREIARLGEQVDGEAAKLASIAAIAEAEASELGLDSSSDRATWAGLARERMVEIAVRLEALRVLEVSALRAVERAREMRRATDEARKAHDAAQLGESAARDALAQATRALEDCEALVTRADAEMARSQSQVSTQLASLGAWQERLEADPEAFVASTRTRVDEHRTKLGARTRIDEELSTKRAALEGARAVCDEQTRSAERAAKERDEAEAAWRRLADERAALLGGRGVAEVQAELDVALAGARRHLDETNARVATMRESVAALRAQLDAALDSEREAGEAATLASTSLDEALAAAHLDRDTLRARLDKRGEWLEATRRELDATAKRLDEARGAFHSQKLALEQHAAKARPALGEAELYARLDAARLASEQRIAEEARLDQQRRADDEARERARDMGEELARRRAAAERWAALSGLIGSSDGKKLPRFAQSLTLDAMLVHANHHLGELAPRYALVRVPGSDLDLQIVDRDMCDEVRSIQSLSGGESFLVSLALALALSSLASRDVRVDTLFIDEGFGTLDPQTLETALAALDALQSSGRQIGIISHVPGLAQRIGAQVQVRKLGAGRSRVVVSASDAHEELLDVANGAAANGAAAGATAGGFTLTTPTAAPKRARKKKGG
jgi:exonuclease SbcC